MSLAYFRELYMGHVWSAKELNSIWQGAIDAGIITGDMNLDGDFDDAGQLEIAKPQALANMLGLPLRYLDGHFSPTGPEAVAPGRFIVTAWYNPATKFTHFVVGSSRPVEFDPIKGGSRTVREGAPKGDGARIYQMMI
jgi:hypothetical protein